MKRVGITDKDRAVLDVVKRLRFVTREHLAYGLQISESTAHRALKRLETVSLLKAYSEQTPYVYRLSDSGAAIVGATYQQRWHSAPAMHQYLMRNEFEMYYRSIKPTFRFMDRMRLKSFGLSPQVAEHPARLDKQTVLVLIDDYLMRPSRAHQVLDRVHETKSNESYLERIKHGSDVSVPTWRKAISKLLIVTTNEAQLAVYKRSYDKKPLSIDYELHHVPPVWSIA